jgi:diguanylate cyclase (GGDEF)-like protein
MQAQCLEASSNDTLALRAAVENELARDRSSWRFPRILQRRYEADRAVSRARELRRLASAAAVFYPLISLFMHFVVARRQPGLAMCLQLLLFVPCSLVARRVFARPGLSARAREGVALGLCCLVLVGASLHVGLAPRDIVAMDMFFMVTPVIGCMFYTRMTPLPALGLIVFGVVGLMAAAWLRGDIAMATAAYPLGGLATSSGFALIASRELDNAMRRTYLVGLRQTLQIQDLAAENLSLDLLSTTDPLTGAGNRRHFEKALMARGSAPGRFLLLVDIDYFKQLNDLHGHAVGDACLREAVIAMRCCLRPSDSLARLGGDEFAVLMCGYAPADARAIAERICARVAEHRFEVDGAARQISVTIGAADCQASRDSARLIDLADAALYAAKRAGRGRVAWATTEEAAPQAA